MVRFISPGYCDLAFGAADLIRNPVSVNRLFFLCAFCGLMQDFTSLGRAVYSTGYSVTGTVVLFSRQMFECLVLRFTAADDRDRSLR